MFTPSEAEVTKARRIVSAMADGAKAGKRHGTTTLFAALNVLDGTVIGRNMGVGSHLPKTRRQLRLHDCGSALPQIIED